MRLHKLTLENYGVFEGRAEFNLLPGIKGKKYKPIVLFGGLNGSGKTTAFEAIRLCLYGQKFFDRMSDTEYHKQLADRIFHSNELLLTPDSAMIQLDFEYSHFGKVEMYSVERRWFRAGHTIDEVLTIKRDGVPLTDVEKQLWPDFIQELVPQGVSQLFFFDGEKIKNMLSDDQFSEFGNSLQSLLGLDLVDRLQRDLKIYRSKRLNETAGEGYQEEHNKLHSQLNEIQLRMNKLRETLGDYRVKQERLQNDLVTIEDRIRALGGDLFKDRENLQVQLKILETEIEQLREVLRAQVSTLFPVTLCPGLISNLLDQVDQDEEYQQWQDAGLILSGKRDELIDELNSERFWKSISDITATTQKKITSKISTRINKLFAIPADKTGEVIFPMSSNQRAIIRQDLRQATETLPQYIQEILGKIEIKHRELQDVRTRLDIVPDESSLRPLFVLMNRLNTVIGKRREQIRRTEEELHREEVLMEDINRKISRVELKLASNRRHDLKLKLVHSSERVLHDYRKQLALTKIVQLEENFNQIFTRFHRKNNMLSRISIDPETFRITLYNKRDEPDVIKRDQLSSGEQEIFAISLLWALAKVSGATLPFIIDTPLGRLDSEHRDRLVEHFFPFASHQVVIFSTNTEVDQEYFNQLKPHVSRSYHLKFDNSVQHTTIAEEYFWK